MANLRFKGRQKGSTKKITTITDPLLGDYKILSDEDNYNLIYTDPLSKKEKVIGYYTQLGGALKRVVRNQMVEKQPVYSLKEYINELETTLEKLKNIID